MKIRLGLILILLGLPLFSLGQPTGTISARSGDVSFKSDSTITASPSEIAINLELLTTTENTEEAVPEHLSTQKEIFKQLNGYGVSYQGQPEASFLTRESTGFLRRKSTVTVTSNIRVTVVTDDQLALVSDLISRANVLIYSNHNIKYKDQDSLDDIQKRVTSDLLKQSEEYQANNDRKLRPVGFSQMDIDTEIYGEKTVQDMLEGNTLPDGTALSSEALEIIGTRHKIVAELIFR